MHSQIRRCVNAFIFWCMAFCTGGRIFPHYLWVSGAIIRRILSSAQLEKRTFVFALRKEKMFQSFNLCPSVKGRFKNRSPVLKWTEISGKKEIIPPPSHGLLASRTRAFDDSWAPGAAAALYYLPQSDSSAHRPTKASPPRAGLLAPTSLVGIDISEARSATVSLLQGEFSSVHCPLPTHKSPCADTILSPPQGHSYPSQTITA